MKYLGKILFVIISIFLWDFPVFSQCENSVNVKEFFKYDKNMLLKAKEKILKETDNYIQYHIIYESIHNKKVPALFTLPKKYNPPYKVVIYQHGLSEKKDAEQISFGTEKLVSEGYAVFSIDSEYHGERKKEGVVPSGLISRMQFYTFRDMLIQTVVDIRRGVDYLTKRKDIDREKIAYIGISMGGIIGVIVSGIDERIKVPIFIVAGGNLKKMLPESEIFQEFEEILKVIDPVYFVEKIYPRPVFMINGLKDFTMAESAKELYEKAKEPKEIIWIDADHIGVPFKEETVRAILEILKKNLR